MSDSTALRPFLSAADLEQRIGELAGEISADYQGRTLDVVAVINGAGMFANDLVRRLTVPVRYHALAFGSYPGGSESGEVRLTLDVAEPLAGRHVLLVEGIVVSGRTPRYVLDLLARRNPASLALCTLGRKQAAVDAGLEVAYCGYDFGAEYLVGYGIGSSSQKPMPGLMEVQT